MKTAACLLIASTALLITACASDKPEPNNVTYNNTPAPVTTPASPQTTTGNTFYTAPVTTTAH